LLEEQQSSLAGGEVDGLVCSDSDQGRSELRIWVELAEVKLSIATRTIVGRLRVVEELDYLLLHGVVPLVEGLKGRFA
jgi:hypothetical protein